MANVNRNQQQGSYLTLTFSHTGGTEVIRFSNMEIRADLVQGRANYPEIFASAAGVATAIARLQPVKITATILTDIPQTICKLKDIVRITRGKYSLRLCIAGFWDCIKTVDWDPDLGLTLGIPPGTIQGGPIGNVPASRLPGPGDPVLINGMGPVIYTQDMIDAQAKDILAEVPWCMDCVIRYDAAVAFGSQARAHGARRNEPVVLEFLETTRLSLPFDYEIIILIEAGPIKPD